VELDSAAIQAIIPHRPPFLLVDRILELEPGRRAVGQKHVSPDDPVFRGHFPGRPIFPGVLILEAMAQVGAVALLAAEEHRGKLGLFAGIDRVRFRRPVLPGDLLRLEVELVTLRGRLGKARGRATVADRLAAEGEVLFALADAEAVGGPSGPPGR